MEGLGELASVEALRSPLSAGGGFPGGVTPPWSREPAGLDSGPEAGDYSQSYLPGEGEGKAPPPLARKEAATAQSGDPGPCPYMGSRKRLARLPYVIISKFSRGSLALPVAGRYCSPVGGWGRGERGAFP